MTLLRTLCSATSLAFLLILSCFGLAACGTEPCRCALDLPEGRFEAACGQGACAGTTGYMCSASQTATKDVNACPPPQNFSAGAGGPAGWTEQTQTLDGKSRAFGLYVPASYTGATGVPLVLHFHGWRPLPAGVKSEVKYVWGTVAEANNFIAVALEGQACPQLNFCGNEDCGCFLEDEDTVAVNQLITHLEGLYNIDRDRMYLSGHSGGSYFIQGLGISNATKFAAAVEFSGGCVSSGDNYINSCSLYAEKSKAATRKLPFYLMHNPDDQVVPFDWDLDLKFTLEQNNHPLKVMHDPYDGGSSGHSVPPSLVPDVWTFLSGYHHPALK